VQHGQWGAQLVAGVRDEATLQRQRLTQRGDGAAGREEADQPGDHDSHDAGDQQRIPDQRVVVAIAPVAPAVSVQVRGPAGMQQRAQHKREDRHDDNNQRAGNGDLPTDPAGGVANQVGVGRTRRRRRRQAPPGSGRTACTHPTPSR
jgi:hypothetical protein